MWVLLIAYHSFAVIFLLSAFDGAHPNVESEYYSKGERKFIAFLILFFASFILPFILGNRFGEGSSDETNS